MTMRRPEFDQQRVQKSDMTKFEPIWKKPEEQIFRSDTHDVFAFADAFPKLPYAVVVAARRGTPGRPQPFRVLPPTTKRLLHEVADAVEEKIATVMGDAEMTITHTECRGITNHAHIVVAAGADKEGIGLYARSNLGLAAVNHTLEVVRFSPEESQSLEERLAFVARG